LDAKLVAAAILLSAMTNNFINKFAGPIDEGKD